MSTGRMERRDEAPEEEETKPGHQLDMGSEGEQRERRAQFSIWGTGWMKVELLIEGNSGERAGLRREDVLSDLRHKKSLRCQEHELGDVQSIDGYLGDT